MRIYVAIFAVVTGVAVCQARVIIVDDDGPAYYPTIQAAINDADNGDIVELQPGIYTGPGNRDIDLLGKVITLRGSSGAEHCVIDCNASENDRHYGLYIHDNSGPLFFQAVIEGITIRNGYLQTVCSGGSAIRCYSSSPTIRNCVVMNNGAELVPESLCFCNGGAVYLYRSRPTFEHCILKSNWVGSWGLGGAVYCDPDSTLTMYNCLIIQNTATQHSGSGGAIYCDYGGELNITNCTIADNAADEEGGGIFIFQYNKPMIMNVTSTVLWGNQPKQIFTTGPEVGKVRYCLVEGGWPGLLPPFTGLDPLFVNPDGGDYHLRWSSPCIDRGDPGCAYDPNETDVDGEPRVTGDRVDIGCDEVGPKQSDFSRDGAIDLEDYSVLTRSYGAGPADSNWSILADLYEDDHIDYLDLAVFVNDWLWISSWHPKHP